MSTPDLIKVALDAGAYALGVQEVGGSHAVSASSIVLDHADPLRMRVYELGDGTYALGVAARRLGEVVTADGLPVTDQTGIAVTVYV